MKAQGLSMNFIIVALLAIAVLVVILFVFGGKAKIFSMSTTKTCDFAACKRAIDDNCNSDEAKGFAKLKADVGYSTDSKYNSCQGKKGKLVSCCVKIETN